jgi:hypothetical protein
MEKQGIFEPLSWMEVKVICVERSLVKSRLSFRASWCRSCFGYEYGWQIENCEGHPTAMHHFIGTMLPGTTR